MDLGLDASLEMKNLNEEVLLDAEDELASSAPVIILDPEGVAEQFARL